MRGVGCGMRSVGRGVWDEVYKLRGCEVMD